MKKITLIIIKVLILVLFATNLHGQAMTQLTFKSYIESFYREEWLGCVIMMDEEGNEVDGSMEEQQYLSFMYGMQKIEIEYDDEKFWDCLDSNNDELTGCRSLKQYEITLGKKDYKSYTLYKVVYNRETLYHKKNNKLPDKNK